jgi:site-specific recombinase XerD
VASENAKSRPSHGPESASENTKPARRGRTAVEIAGPYRAVLDEYLAALSAAPLAERTRRTYASKVRQYLAWLATADVDGDPFQSIEGRDWAVRDYRTHLQAVLKRRPATVNNALAAVDDLYIRSGLGPARAKRAEIPQAAPRALSERAQIRYLRAVQDARSPRDRALALVPFYAGARISETVALDLDDLRLSARKAILRIYGKGERVREIPIHPQLRKALDDWLHERPEWPNANENPALFLNQRGRRLSARGAHDIITGIAVRHTLDEHVTAPALRHSFATALVRGHTDLVIDAELLGHARLETTRLYTRPSAGDRAKAIDLLVVDE